MSVKQNCWEFKKCGRAIKSGEICPAASEIRLDEIHGGQNGGRACWVIAGTFCGGVVAGTFARKFDTCEKCEFYQSVKKEENSKFILSSTLISIMRVPS